MNHNLFSPFHRLIGRIDERFLNRRSSRLLLCHETLTKDIKALLEIDSSQYAAFLSVFNVRDSLEGVFRLIRFQNHQERSWSDEFFSVSLSRDFSVINIRKEIIAVKNPEDPRIFFLHEIPYVFLNTWDGPWIYNYFTKETVKLSIRSFAPYSLDKNWTPFVDGNKLYFIYSFSPLTILSCEPSTGICDLVQGEPASSAEAFVLRGGTAALKFGDSFVGIAHSNIRTKLVMRHRPHIFVMKKDPFRLVFVGPPLSVGGDLIQDPCNIFKHEGEYYLSMTVSYGAWTYPNRSITMKIVHLLDFEKNITQILTDHDLPLRDTDERICRYYKAGIFC
jgi:hypothetical protein